MAPLMYRTDTAIVAKVQYHDRQGALRRQGSCCARKRGVVDIHGTAERIQCLIGCLANTQQGAAARGDRTIEAAADRVLPYCRVRLSGHSTRSLFLVFQIARTGCGRSALPITDAQRVINVESAVASFSRFRPSTIEHQALIATRLACHCCNCIFLCALLSTLSCRSCRPRLTRMQSPTARTG